MNGLKQNIIILSLILLIIIILVVIAFFSFSLIKVGPEPVMPLQNLNTEQDQSLNISDTSPAAQQERRDQREKEVNNYDLAIAQADFQLCAEVSQDSIRDLCYNNIAINTMTFSTCNYMKSEIGTQRCQLEVSLAKGAQEKSLKACDNLLSPDLKQRCVSQLQDNNFCLSEECL
ncbi:hypothetical protein ACFL2U_02545 [Patescibacteria group bacterium]